MSSRSPPGKPCRFCGERPAVELLSLGPLGRYRLFCSIECAALRGIQAALEKTPPDERDELKE